jgi:Peptidase propeptide and YPEB domain
MASRSSVRPCVEGLRTRWTRFHCSDKVQADLYNDRTVIRPLATFAAVALTACALLGASAALADPPDWQGRAGHGEQRGGYGRPGFEPGVGPTAVPGVWSPRDHRVEPRDSYPRPSYDRGGGERRYGPPVQATGRFPNSLGAEWREQQDEARYGVNQGRLAPLGRVIENIGRRTPGRQLDAGIEYLGGRPVYRVRWMTHDGRRIDYLVDAATGTIMGER